MKKDLSLLTRTLYIYVLHLSSFVVISLESMEMLARDLLVLHNLGNHIALQF